jgi:hypothetical protein
MHLSEGEIRAYQDHELDSAASDRVQSHLIACQRCLVHAEQILTSSQSVRAEMRLLAEQKPPYRLSTAAARARLKARQSAPTKEYEAMSNKWYKRISRPAWAVIAIVAVLAVAMAFEPVQAIANNFLGLFRVQQIQVVQVNPGALPDQLGSSSQFEAMISQDVQFQDNGKVQDVASAAEASGLAGIPVRLPQGLSGSLSLKVTPSGTATMKIDVQHLRALLAEIGRSDIQVPNLVDGSTLTLQVPAGVQAGYGDCHFDLDKVRQPGQDPDTQSIPRMPNCTTLMQMPSPTIQAPPGLDIQQIGIAYLQVMGMSQQDAENFARNVDWTTTFVIPIPRYNTTTQQVSVDGVTGSLIQQGAREYLLLWVKDGIVYALTGPGDANTALQIAGSLQ